MKLNADIIYERLSQTYPAEMYGSRSKKLLLPRPEMYIDDEVIFIKNHLYLATVEHLPQRPRIENNVALVCIGDSPRLTYYKEHATLIIIKDKVNFFEVYRALQEIYEIFDRWENQLLEIFLGDVDINKIIACSYEVFQKPINLLDSSFQLVGATSAQAGNLLPVFGGSLSHDSIGAYLNKMDLYMDKKGAMLLEFPESSWLCVNIFDRYNEYNGCLVIGYSDGNCPEGEFLLAERLAGIVEKAYEKSPRVLSNDRTALKDALQRLLQELSIGAGQRLLFDAMNFKDRYVCLSMHHTNHLSPLPSDYICTMFELSFRNSITLTQDNAILALVNLSSLGAGDNYRNMLDDKLPALLGDMRLNAGVSKEFNDLGEIKIRYFQAEAAIENGLLTNPGHSIYHFDDYVLTEMIVNSLGGLPVEAYFPDGFKKLLEHDKTSGISYLETLKVFFEENMSYSKTAARIYVHRSTLIDRIARIEKELKLDFNNAKQRLLLQLILSALSVEETIKKR